MKMFSVCDGNIVPYQTSGRRTAVLVQNTKEKHLHTLAFLGRATGVAPLLNTIFTHWEHKVFYIRKVSR